MDKWEVAREMEREGKKWREIKDGRERGKE